MKVTGLKKNRAPFGVKSKRFENAGLHPSLEKRSGTRRFPCVAPGSYDFSLPEKSFFQTGWSRSLETEEFSKNLGFFAPDLIKGKIRAKESNGPGWHEYVSPVKAIKMSFPKEARFVEPRRVDTPGPGFYSKDRAHPYSCGSGVGTFERDNFRERDSGGGSGSPRLPPNLYRIPSFVDRLLLKVVSKRGPYDLFTGPRNETSLYGHFRKSSAKNAADTLYDFPSGAEILKSRENAVKGKFARCGRDTVPFKRNLDHPGPAHYDLASSSIGRTSSAFPYPFGSSLLYARPPTKIGLKPGPGRYENDKCLIGPIRGNGWKSAFVSKTKRGGPFPDRKSWFE